MIEWEEESRWLAPESSLTFSSCCPEAATGTRLRTASFLRERKLREQLTPALGKCISLIHWKTDKNWKKWLLEALLVKKKIKKQNKESNVPTSQKFGLVILKINELSINWGLTIESITFN